ncbi:MAG: HAMP domain-containing histidine kinase [Deltaproteobacteria bacterium]|nr:HAMP domain-containing histidine kinase [Deltaproteobacteria bacterium]
MLYERLSDDERRKMVQDIRRQMRILNNLIGDVLEISRIDSGNISQEQQRINLAQLVRDEVDKQLPVAQKKFQTLRTSGVEKLTVCGSDSQLRQVIRNLLSNAIKYTPDKGSITCEWLALPANESSETAWPGVSSLPDGHWLALRVVDNGIGIDEKDLPHLFDRFYRVESQSNIPGTGLGLSIAQELVELHDGRLAVASTPGEGSIFALYLPLLETN